MSKRNFLKAAGVLGTGAVLGGGAASELTGDAQAAASTTDGDGDIGTPANPEDVFADALAVFDGPNNQIGSFDETGIETPSVNTEQASIGLWDGQVSGLDGGDQSIPYDTETKLQFGPTADQDPFGEWDSSNYEVVARTDGRLILSVSVRILSDSGWSTGDDFGFVPRINGSPASPRNVSLSKVGTDTEAKPPYVHFYEVSEGDRLQFNFLHRASDGSSKSIGDNGNETVLQWAVF